MGKKKGTGTIGSKGRGKRAAPARELSNIDVEQSQPQAVKSKIQNKRKRSEDSDGGCKIALRSNPEANSDNNNATPVPVVGNRSQFAEQHFDALDSLLPSNGKQDDDLDYMDDIQVTIQAREEDEFPVTGQGDVESTDNFDPLAEGDNNDNHSECESNVVTFNPNGPSNLVPTEANYVQWKNDPAFSTFIKKLVAAEVSNASGSMREMPTPTKGANRVVTKGRPTPVQSMEHSRVLKTPTKVGPGGNEKGGIQVKSPSDTTLYAPALNFVPNSNLVTDVVNPQTEVGTNIPLNVNNDQFDAQVSQFIQGIRMQSAVTVPAPAPVAASMVSRPVPAAGAEPQPGTSGEGAVLVNEFDRQVAQGKDRAAEMVLQAEQFKAAVNTPGNFLPPQFEADHLINPNNGLNSVQTIENDDDFFHVSCHVDPVLKGKIQKGDFVELERLLPKPRGMRVDNTGRMDIVFKDGRSYFVPAAL